VNEPFNYEAPVKVSTTLPASVNPDDIWGDSPLQVQHVPSSEPLVLQWLDGIHWREFGILSLAMTAGALLGSVIL